MTFETPNDGSTFLFFMLKSARVDLSIYLVFSGPYFSVFGLNTEICGVNLGIQLEYRKIWTRKNSVFGHFSCSTHLKMFLFFLHEMVKQKLIMCLVFSKGQRKFTIRTNVSRGQMIIE